MVTEHFCSAEKFHRECDNFAPICGTLWQRDLFVRSKTRRDGWLFCVWGYALSRLSLVTKGRAPEIVTDFWVWMARWVCVAVLLLFQLAHSRKTSIGKQAAQRERGSGRSNAIYINALAQKLAKATVNWNSVSGLCHMSLIQLIKPIVCISGLASLSPEI